MKWHLGIVLALVGGLLTSQAQAAVVYFSDGFEAQSDPLGNPFVGLAWRDVGIGDNHALETTTVFAGNNALEVIRDNASANLPSLIGVGNAGGLVAGNVIEYVFHLNQVESPEGTTHNFNGPTQVDIMFSGGQVLASFGTLDGGSENYFVTDAGGPNVNTGVTMPRNTAAYDAIRLVLTLTEPAAGTIGGTYEVFIDVDDADGIATTSLGTFNLAAQTVPAAESTNPAFRIQRGPFTSTSLYDDISITQVIPEPGSMALLFGGAALMIVCRRTVK